MTASDFTIVCPPHTLHREIVQRVRAAARQISDFEEGAIAVRFVAKCYEAVEWLGKIEAAAGDTDVDVDFIHSIIPGKSKTRSAGWRGDPTREAVACAGFVMLKLEACAKAVIGGYGYSSDSLPSSEVVEGQYAGPGAMCFDIMPFDGRTGEVLSKDPWLRIYVGVSGATGEEDKWCAYHAWQAIVKCADASHASHIRRLENYNPNISCQNGLIHFRNGALTTENIV